MEGRIMSRAWICIDYSPFVQACCLHVSTASWFLFCRGSAGKKNYCGSGEGFQQKVFPSPPNPLSPEIRNKLGWVGWLYRPNLWGEGELVGV